MRKIFFTFLDGLGWICDERAIDVLIVRMEGTVTDVWGRGVEDCLCGVNDLRFSNLLAFLGGARLFVVGSLRCKRHLAMGALLV